MTTLTLHNGDCLEVMKDISANSISMIICDLPYGCLTSQTYKGVIDKSNSNLGEVYGEKLTWDIKIDLEKFWEQAQRILRDEHCPVIHFCTTKFGYELIKSKESWFRYDLVYSKTNAVGFLSANKKPMTSHEMIYVFCKSGAYYNRIDITGNYPKGGGGTTTSKFLPIAGMPNKNTTVAGVRCVKSVIEVSNRKTKGGHPTEKPVEIYRWLIERYSSPGDTILDPTFGSGNSVFTAFEMGRNAIGIEKDTGFYEKAAAKIT